MKNTKELVGEITNYVNSFNSKGDEFCKAMSVEHRTLQQSFTKLCFEWIEFIANEDYRTDPRNEQSQKVAQDLLEAFKELKIKEGWNGYTLDMMSKPSGYLRCI